MKKIFLTITLVLLFASCTVREEENFFALGDDVTQEEEASLQEEEIETLMPDIPRYDKYRVSLEIDPEGRTASGLSHITFTNRAGVSLNEVVIRTYLNAFDKDAEPPVFPELEWRAFPNGRDFGSITIQYAFLDHEPLEFFHDGTVLTLNLPEPLEPFETVQLLVQYGAIIPQISHRTGANEFAQWFGMFLPVLAVFDDETGWHTEPHYASGEPFLLEMANFRVEITTPARYSVVGTGLRTEEVMNDTDTKITHFTAHQARDFAFALSPYFHHANTSTESGIDIHIYYYTETLQPDEILESARRSMEFFERNVGTYPLGHVTIVETELTQDSLSFSQIVFADSRSLRRGGPYWSLAHGLGNQWFSNVVGTNQIAEPWLTEGLTRYIQAGLFYHTPDELRTRMEHDFESIEDATDLFLRRGLDASENRVHYAYTHGRKAMLMLYALNSRMGDEIFWQFISDYYQKFSFNIATVNDFTALAEETLGECLQDFFAEWLDSGTVPQLP